MDVTLVLTHDCNLGCGYCYAGRKFRRAMPREVALAGLDLAFAGATRQGVWGGGSWGSGREATAAGDPQRSPPNVTRARVGYFGGEPTLEWDLLASVAEEARRRAEAAGIALQQTVTTNGTLLSAERVRRLHALGVYVALSIDGNRAAHEKNRPSMGGASSWEAASGGLDLLLDAGRAFETISVVTPASAGDLGESVRELLARGVPRVSLSPCYEASWSDEDLARWERGLEEAASAVAGWLRRGRVVSVNVFDNKILARQKGGLSREDRCAVGDGAVAVAPSGHLYPCERLVGEDDQPALRVGHVSTGVDRERVRALRSPAADRHAVNEECGACVERPRCGASCACANLAETGDPHVAGGVQCWHEQTTARIADALLAAMLAESNETFLRRFFPRGAPPVGEPPGTRVPRAARRLPVLP
jgi:uncharacterized protein